MNEDAIHLAGGENHDTVETRCGLQRPTGDPAVEVDLIEFAKLLSDNPRGVCVSCLVAAGFLGDNGKVRIIR